MKGKTCTMSKAQTKRLLDCVTVKRMGGVTVTLKGDSRHNAKAGEEIVRRTARHGGADSYADTS